MSRDGLFEFIVGFVARIVRTIDLSSNAGITFGTTVLEHTLDLT
jgi:hypothetical protein